MSAIGIRVFGHCSGYAKVLCIDFGRGPAHNASSIGGTVFHIQRIIGLIIAKVNIIAPTGLGSVSYTHLDVYKRQVQSVTKMFGVNCVLKDINLTLKQGQRMGLVGVNGSGKSTLFKIIVGQDQPDEGTVSLVKGAKVGLLTQHADIQSELTVYQELERVFEPLKAMEQKLRDLEARMAEEHQDERAMMALSEEYDRLTRRFEDAGGYEWPSRIAGVLAGLGLSGERQHQRVGLLSGEMCIRDRDNTSMISSAVRLSSEPVGSSASRIDGSMISARAMATRCFWPPERWAAGRSS